MEVDITIISKKERKSCLSLIDILHTDVNANVNININILNFKIQNLKVSI